MAETGVDKGAVDTAAGKLGNLMSGEVMTIFRDLEPHWPQAGGFSTGQFLENRVDNRRNAIVEHADRLKIILEEMSSQVKDIASKLTDTDADNAKMIKDQLEQLRTDTQDEIASHDEELEAKQGNFTAGEGSGGDNGADGDGYDDQTGEPISGLPEGEERIDQSPVPEHLWNVPES